MQRFWVTALLASAIACGDSNDPPAEFNSVETLVPSDDPPPVTNDDIQGSAQNPPPSVVRVSSDLPGLDGATLVAEVPTFQDVVPGTLVDAPPQLRFVDELGDPLAGVEVRFTAVGGGEISPSTAISDEAGFVQLNSWRVGKSIGNYAVDASAAGAVLRFVAEATSDYTITLDYRTPVAESVRQAFDDAAARWSGVLRGDLAPVPINTRDLPTGCGQTSNSNPMTIDDILILVRVIEIDGAAGVLGQAGPCLVRTNDRSPLVGIMEFDEADLAQLQSLGRLKDVILHEMAHVLGVGTLWGFGLVQNPSVPNDTPGVDTRFIGERAVAAYQLAGGGTDDSVPVENDAQPGSGDSHWRESVFRNELMSPRLSPNDPSLPLSMVTAGSLEDLGFYEVNSAATDPYTLPTTNPSALELVPEANIEIHDVLVRPSHRVDADGTMHAL